MLPRLDAAIVTPVKPADGAGAGVAIGDGRQAAFQRAVQSLVGQTVPAEVLSKLKDGSYLVKVAENSVRLMLPGDTQVGSSVPLTVLAAQPRPTFQLGTSAPGSAPTLLYTEAGTAEGGEAASLPSQGTVVLPNSGKPASGAPQGTPGTPAGGAGAGAAADAEGGPGQLKPGLPGAPAAGAGAAAGAGNAAANAGNAAAAGRPGLPAGAAPDTPDAATPPAAGRPAVAAGNAGATPNPAAALATPATPAQAQAAATLAAGTPGSAVPAEAVKPQSLAATLLGKAPLTPAHELPELSPNTPPATLSSAARVLTTVLSTAQAGQVALIGKTALFGNTAPDTDALAQKLHDTVSKSGLFYESHVAEWAKGERPLAELMREPQMQRLLQQQGNESAARAATSGPDLSAAQMINQQLHTQEQNRVLWHGQAWPGQEMQWEVRRDQREGGQGGSGDADGEPEQIWRSGVRFRLPMLGAVSAAVTLVGEQVHIQVQTDSDGSAVTLRAYASQLESAMAAAGAQLSSLTIGQADDHD